MYKCMKVCGFRPTYYNTFTISHLRSVCIVVTIYTITRARCKGESIQHVSYSTSTKLCYGVYHTIHKHSSTSCFYSRTTKLLTDTFFNVT